MDACGCASGCLRATGLAQGLALLVGCAPAVKPPVFVPREVVPLAGVPSGVADWPELQRWRRCHEPQLVRLVGLAARDSLDIEVAPARSRAALQAADIQPAALDPQATGLMDATHGYNK